MNPGRFTVADNVGGRYSVAVDIPQYKPGGFTPDWANVAAEATSRTLDSGYVTQVGEKVIPAGTPVYRKSATLWEPAVAATSLVRGEIVVLDYDLRQSVHLDQCGWGIVGGNVYKVRLKVGGAGQPTLASLLAAMPNLVVID